MTETATHISHLRMICKIVAWGCVGGAVAYGALRCGLIHAGPQFVLGGALIAAILASAWQLRS